MAALPDPEKQSPGKPRLFSPGNTLPFALVTTLFLLWGIPSNLNDVLIKQFMKSFEMNRFQAGLIQSAFYLGYFLLALPAALVMRKYGYKTGLVIGLLLFGTGALLFWPAAVVQRYGFFCLRSSSSLAACPFWKPARTPSSRSWVTPERRSSA